VATPIPPNRASFTLPELVAATGAELVAGDCTAVSGVTTDSRGDVRGQLFVALAGENFDGHDFARAAAESGARALLTSRPVEPRPNGVAVLRVADTLTALGSLAALHRRRWGSRVAVVGGSAGKTTTRTVVSAILSEVRPGAVHFAAGNLNNLVGVPMVLFGLGPEHRYGVVELGTNQPGEVRRLGEMVAPDVALLTLVALEHTAGLGSLDQIEVEEGDILRSLLPDGVAIANGDDTRALRQLRQSPARRRLSYGTGTNSDYRLLGRKVRGPRSVWLELARAGDDLAVESPLVGEAGALAVLGGLAAAEALLGEPLESSALGRALGRPELVEPGRLVPVELADGSVVLDDSYNSNPASVRSSVQAARELAEQRGSRLLLVLGEMRELGADSAREHQRLGAELGDSGASHLFAVCGDARHLVDAARHSGVRAVFAPDAESVLPLLLEELNAGDVVLVKASRGVRAERVVSGLQRAKGLVA
jgi:UDP-N-acetylmuramoyl-tripeptide--D-alanyl-D-alanine ligase